MKNVWKWETAETVRTQKYIKLYIILLLLEIIFVSVQANQVPEISYSCIAATFTSTVAVCNIQSRNSLW